MKSWQKLVLVFAVGALSGCAVGSSEPETVVVSSDGTLTVTWTVVGTSDPQACGLEGADSIDIRVETSARALVAETSAGCEDGAASLDLPPGVYFGDAALLDAAGHVITTSVDLGRITIQGDEELVVDTDFPADSFY